MPAWWGRKSNKSKEETNHQTSKFELNPKKSPINSENNSNDNSKNNSSHNNNDKNKNNSSHNSSKNNRSPRSVEEGNHGLLSPKLRGNNSREFDADNSERKVAAHPLPRPTNYGVVAAADHGSASISSVSSSGSNSDDPPVVLDHLHSGGFRFVSINQFTLFLLLGLF